MQQQTFLADDPTEVQLGYEWRGADNLIPLLTPCNDLHEHPRNVRQGNVERLIWSLNHFGQMVPIIVQSKTPEGATRNVIVKGNHTYKAAVAIGWRSIAAVFVELDDDTAYQYLLADNKASDIATYDKEALRQGLQSLSDAGQLQNTLFTADDLDDLTSSLGTLESVYQQFEGDYSDDPATRAARAEREQTRVAVKMREVPVVITVDQHVIFMDNIRLLQKEYKTGGAIETILLAVQKQADLLRDPDKPYPVAPATPEPATITPPPPPSTPAAETGQPQPLQAGTAHEELHRPAPRTLEGWAVDEANNLLPEAKAELWFKTGSQFLATIKALKTDPVRRTVIYGVLEALAPPAAVSSIPQAERRRAAVAIRNAIIQNYSEQELPLLALSNLVAQVCPQSVSPLRAES